MIICKTKIGIPRTIEGMVENADARSGTTGNFMGILLLWAVDPHWPPQARPDTSS